MIRCHIHDNGGNRGGGIFTKGTVSFCVVEKNMANGKGGGIGVFGGNDTGSRGIVYNCLVKDNSGSEGGGIHVERYGTVYNCLVTGNTAVRKATLLLAATCWKETFVLVLAISSCQYGSSSKLFAVMAAFSEAQ